MANLCLTCLKHHTDDAYHVCDHCRQRAAKRRGGKLTSDAKIIAGHIRAIERKQQATAVGGVLEFGQLPADFAGWAE